MVGPCRLDTFGPISPPAGTSCSIGRSLGSTSILAECYAVEATPLQSSIAFKVELTVRDGKQFRRGDKSLMKWFEGRLLGSRERARASRVCIRIEQTTGLPPTVHLP